MSEVSWDAVLLGFRAPLYALPIDGFRVLAGIVSFFYFARTLGETEDFSSPDGLIDHRLSHELLPPTRLSFFQPPASAGVLRGVFLLACLASLMMTAGYLVKPTAVFLFLVAVSTYRWNMLVTYVDDAIVHIVLLWLILLPIGQTLLLSDLLREGSGAVKAWTEITVQGDTTRLFLVNLGLVYFVAGAYKWTSPMWRGGSALYAILKLPIAYKPEMPASWNIPLLRAANYGALVLEPLFPLIFVLPASSAAKGLLLASVVGFHLGIVATLKIPFANLAMLGAIPIVLHDEVMLGVIGRPSPQMVTPMGIAGAEVWMALALVCSLSGMLILEIRFAGRLTPPPQWKTRVPGFRRNPLCAILWCAGVAQSYRLFDWIDLRNYHVSYRVVEQHADGQTRGLDPTDIFPTSIRHILLQSYLHGCIWVQLDPEGLQSIRRAILERYARRYARRRPNTGTLDVYAIRQRVTPDNLTLTRGEQRLLIRFSCTGGVPEIEYLSLDPEEGAVDPSRSSDPDKRIGPPPHPRPRGDFYVRYRR